MDTGPTEAPPSPREEKIAARAGFVWIPGRWDWKAGKWDWVAGHWERERAGKKWREGRWDRRDNRWVFVPGEWMDAGPPAPPTTTPPGQPPPVTNPPPPPPGMAGPREAPPPPREEKFAARAGFVWVPGQWDWRNNKWEWVAGHWERERKGKRWRPARWEKRGDFWARVDGDWIDDGPPGAPPMPPGAQGPRRPRWTLERPVVSNYWPAKGKAGTRVVIRGRNFPPNAEVVFAGQPLRGVKAKGDQIMFVVPKNAVSGAISLRTGGRREMVVGMFEVVPDFDPVAEQRRLEEERRRQAEAAWAARQAQLAKDRAAREAALRQRWEQLQATREQRRRDQIAALQARWERAFLADEDTQAELTLHAQRSAQLARMRDLAELSANAKLAVRIEIAQSRERDRHQQRMAALQASFKLGGGR